MMTCEAEDGYSRALAEQQRIASEIASSMVGRKLRVLADAPRTARTEADAPDVDCRVILGADVPPGEFCEVEVTGSRVYDLLAEPAS